MADITTADRVHDDELLGRTARGDADAFAALYRRRHPEVFRFAIHMTGSATVAEDITQDVFLAVMREAGRYEPGRSSVAAWLCGIARNHVLRRLERDRRWQPIPEDDDDGNGAPQTHAVDTVGALIRSEQLDALQKAIQTLPLPYREAVVLCDLQELSYADAAAVLSCAVGTIRSRLHRARALLLTKLKAAGHAREPGDRSERVDVAEPKMERGGCVA
jgi:RNA polymerase sigma-70 factor, ECF subfamily